jgi:hypothetical protein
MIPHATTTVTVEALAELEPGAGQSATTRASSVRAVIAAPSGREIAGPGGGVEAIDAVLVADPITGLRHRDRVTDDDTGLVYEVVWVADRRGLGLNHHKAGLVKVTR